ncbi:M41 family metallopeptidase [Seonamhaeicola maritimus]|uniref:Peptidase M41 domain-containing protein n=1 Tax=Seonamhaeicola maritimus TaxID=2591822 RepID=A0A5C7GGS9_9FLAO|nr:hypothetical protein [Seonamhaeicola maritimus]TXG36722.1 hypothetical protein FUA22_09065 [Seonamhaeicola maritimus]
MRNELKNTAYHEAGHALIYYLLGRNIIFINANEDGTGICKVNPSFKPRYYTSNSLDEHEAEMLEWGMICLSGYASEIKMMGKKHDIRGLFEDFYLEEEEEPESDSECLIYEMEEINKIIGKKHFDIEFIIKAWDKTNEIINKPDAWDAIIMLSNKILDSENNFLWGPEVEEIFNKYDKLHL